MTCSQGSRKTGYGERAVLAVHMFAGDMEGTLIAGVFLSVTFCDCVFFSVPLRDL